MTYGGKISIKELLIADPPSILLLVNYALTDQLIFWQLKKHLLILILQDYTT